MATDLEATVAELTADFARRGIPTTRVDTHISIVLLAGDDVYKFKRAVDFGFLDFSTLEKRAHFCAREVEFNRRYAPGLYRRVVAVTRGPGGLAIDGPGPVVEYAVYMRRFDPDAQLDRLLANDAVSDDEFAALGDALGALHHDAPHATPEFGTSEMSQAQMLAAAEGLAAIAPTAPHALALFRQHIRDADTELAARHRAGFIRDCHGDLHLTNFVRFDGRLVPFDCIEFNDELRYIDVASDFAFLLMDLEFRGASGAANACLNAYLATTGDYPCLRLLPLYCAYRSMVRAKVAWLAADTHPDEGDLHRARSARHIELVARYLAPRGAGMLTITYGVSGSGKTWAGRRLAAREGAIHLRSDVERRRLAGLPARGSSGARVGTGIYRAAFSERTYDRLAELAQVALGAGYPVLVDASFLRGADRARFADLAAQHGATFRILECAAPRATLEARIRHRAELGVDPSEATVEVLAHQLATREPLSEVERRYVLAPPG